MFGWFRRKPKPVIHYYPMTREAQRDAAKIQSIALDEIEADGFEPRGIYAAVSKAPKDTQERLHAAIQAIRATAVKSAGPEPGA